MKGSVALTHREGMRGGVASIPCSWPPLAGGSEPPPHPLGQLVGAWCGPRHAPPRRRTVRVRNMDECVRMRGIAPPARHIEPRGVCCTCCGGRAGCAAFDRLAVGTTVASDRAPPGLQRRPQVGLQHINSMCGASSCGRAKTVCTPVVVDPQRPPRCLPQLVQRVRRCVYRGNGAKSCACAPTSAALGH